jgi:hypothetical protein
MVDDDVLGLDISMHDADGVSVVESLEDLVDVKFALARSDYVQQLAVFKGGDVLHDEAVDFPFLDDVKQFDGVVLASEGHQYLDLPVDLPELYYIHRVLLGFSILTTHFSELLRLTASKT